MADPVGITEISSPSAGSIFKGADLPGGLYDLKTITKNSTKTPLVNRAIPSGSAITVKQLLSVFTMEFESPLPTPKPGALKLGKVSTGFVLQDAQVNDKGELQYTFLNTGIKGSDGQVAAIQLAGNFGPGEQKAGSTTSGGTITFLFALK
ncbi:hypothetical protein PRZ48_014732 [Zasmidium cellare]|uniref:Uncharacterized protein n=1 Tax=Zasmidium cellare TaxID=395010 RepID=A0ABR0DZ52_ZASCE|nr:hypothetical protein PRZ48_014732 [Zasmidium cellare]